MEYPCVVCVSEVRPRQHAIQCANCERWQHRKCNTGISYKDYRSKVKGELHMHWICITCSEVEDLLETEEGGVLEEIGSIPDISTRPALPEEYEESILPDDIIDEVPVDRAITATEGDDAACLNTVNIARSLNRLRQGDRPDEPDNLNFELDDNYIPKEFLQKDIAITGVA
ncbi:hypothetical protein O3P69_002669 [Scylla paramamosain]|uniref:PHD-type domain-containing protein n=1 Tax=Scylla paramamosain TaxID=85552 RepID=A0AAW0US42_SCYPA